MCVHCTCTSTNANGLRLKPCNKHRSKHIVHSLWCRAAKSLREDNHVKALARHAMPMPAALASPKTLVICYNCRKLVAQKDASYLSEYDTYLCEKCWKDLLDGKPVKLNNWRRSGV